MTTDTDEMSGMKAVVYRKGRGIVAETVATPVIDEDQVLVQVINTGFCGSDHSLIQSGGLPDGTILGHEVSGIVASVGKNVRHVRRGTRVTIRPSFCGNCIDCRSNRPYFCQTGRRSIGIGDLPGAFAEYIKVVPRMLIDIPNGVDSRNAALAEAFAASLHAIESAGKCRGPVLVIGGGPIGLAMVNLLKIMNIGPVVLSEPVKEKRDLGLFLGADQVVDPDREDISQITFWVTKGQGFETVFECSGVARLIQQCLNTVARGGIVTLVSMTYQTASITPLTFNLKEIRLTGSYSNTHEENRRILRWMAEGRLDGRRLISDLVDLEDLPVVYRDRIETGKAVKVMLKIGEEF